ncbi:MAG: L-glutamine synthetase, partial [Marmoricola sp.]|nr:L-glutamine synthetase [Marmoricola sp.]
MTRNARHLTVEDLVSRIDAGDIDTVVVAFTDMQGRLQGKRLHGAYFRDEVLGHGTEGCNYLLGVDVEMNTVEGYAITSWERGYGDMEFVMDLDTIRLLTHLPATAMVQCDLAWPDGSPVVQSPRAIPVLEANIAHSDRQHEVIVEAVLGGDPTRA